jgi:hypothetical protein
MGATGRSKAPGRAAPHTWTIILETRRTRLLGHCCRHSSTPARTKDRRALSSETTTLARGSAMIHAVTKAVDASPRLSTPGSERSSGWSSHGIAHSSLGSDDHRRERPVLVGRLHRRQAVEPSEPETACAAKARSRVCDAGVGFMVGMAAQLWLDARSRVLGRADDRVAGARTATTWCGLAWLALRNVLLVAHTCRGGRSAIAGDKLLIVTRLQYALSAARDDQTSR